METQMLGSVRPFRRQVLAHIPLQFSLTDLALQILISTGKTDWEKEVTATTGSLASHVSRAHQKTTVKPSVNLDADGRPLPSIPGIFNASDSGELSILNGSHKTICEDDELETVLVFPDFVAVAGIPSTLDGAQMLWKTALDPRVPRILGSPSNDFKTWVLPYSCVITLCGHSLACLRLQLK